METTGKQGAVGSVEFALFSDVHGNVAALRAVLADIAARGIDRVYCLGDLIGYGPDPNGVIDLIRAAGIPTILGNYDDGVAFDRGECGCFYADDTARRIGDASYIFTSAAVTPERKAWLRALPGELLVEAAGRRLHLFHGSPRRINEYLMADRDERTYRRLAAQADADILLFGHTHKPWHREYGGILFVNVGSAGRPKDGDARAMYTVLRLEQGRPPVAEVRRVVYDVEETARGVLAVGLPAELAEAFRRGE
jgi:putative phosphoesterase